ncbi:MAG: hypothetical protein H6898_00075 [Rhodobacter sp.]|nr:hypothetical protein [Rhodobacter sp.]
MSTPLSPPVAAALLPSAPPRPVTSATPVETARAPRPVEAAHPAADLRRDTARDKPVGPPPAFEINVLQDIRARLADAPDPAGPEADRDPPSGRDEEPAARAIGPDAPAFRLDRKV